MANIVRVHGQSDPLFKVVFAVKGTASIPKADVIHCEDEKDLLTKWAQFIDFLDPDMMLGYNTTRFKMPYLITRAEANKIDNFASFGRLKDKPVLVQTPTSRQLKLAQNNSLKNPGGFYATKPIGSLKDSHIAGRIHFDMSEVIFRLKKQCGLPSCSLKHSCAMFLDITDLPHMPYVDLPKMQEQDEFTRKTIAV